MYHSVDMISNITKAFDGKQNGYYFSDCSTDDPIVDQTLNDVMEDESRTDYDSLFTVNGVG